MVDTPPPRQPIKGKRAVATEIRIPETTYGSGARGGGGGEGGGGEGSGDFTVKISPEGSMQWYYKKGVVYVERCNGAETSPLRYTVLIYPS